MKTNCNGCRSLCYIDTEYTCRLGYKLFTLPIFGKPPIGVPKEECPKPLTYDKYYTILQDRETADRDKLRSKIL